MKRLLLSAIRLVGFHNYQDVYLPIRGDVFLVGANESGKTTVLDAIQLVLSAERHFVWNAGANPVGRREEGRSLKGIVLRSDLAGNPRLESGIAWAGLEFRAAGADSAPPTTLLFGGSVKSPDSAVQRFGAKVRLPLCDLVLTETDDKGRLRVLRREEVAARHDVEITGRIGDYMRDLEALFGGAEHFERVTRLWQLAKSYKDLALRTRKLSDLFIEFLPPPDPEAFQQVRKGLLDARDIEVKLEQLTLGRDQLRNLARQLTELAAEQESALRLAYIQARRDLDETSGQIRDCHAQIATEEEKTRATLQQRELIEEERRAAQREEEMLRSSAAMGLIERHTLAEEDARRHHQRMGEQAARTEKARAHVATQGRELEALEAALIRQTAGLRHALQSTVAALPTDWATTILIASLLSAMGDLPMPPPEAVSPQIGNEIEVALRDLLQQLTSDLSDTTAALKELDAAIRHLEAEQDRLRRHQELLPPIEGYGELLAALLEAGLEAVPLYRWLEPAAEMDEPSVARLEEFLGMEFLSTLVSAPAQVDRVRALAHSLCPSVRVLDSAVSSEHGLPGCLLSNDPRVAAHTGALWGRLAVSSSPAPEGTAGLVVSDAGEAFRSGARSRLNGQVASFIGTATRARRREREMDRLHAAQMEAAAQRSSVAGRLAVLESQLAACHAAARLFTGHGEFYALASGTASQREKTLALTQAKSFLSEEEARLGTLRMEHERAAAEVQQLRGQIAAADADGVQRRLAELVRLLSQLAGSLTSLASADAVSRDHIQQARQRSVALEIFHRERAEKLTSATEELVGALDPLPDNLDDYVYRTKQGQRGDPATLPNRLREARENVARLDARLRGADGILRPELAAAYRFRIEQSPRLRILTHDGKPLTEILEAREQDVAEWMDRRARRLREVFESLLEKELIGRLVADRRHLHSRLERLNRRLESVTFGGNQYRIRRTVKPEAKWLEENLREQGLLAESARQRLRTSLEDRSELLSAAEDAVPEALDYRCWYEFDFTVIRSGQHDAHGTDISRGSGGAQASYNYLLLFCLAANFFDECNAPIRLLVMDEAFHNLDEDRKQRLLLAAKDLELDLVIATPNLDGTVLGIEYDNTTVLVEKDAADNVTLIPLTLQRQENDLFAEPRPAPIIRSEAPS